MILTINDSAIGARPFQGIGVQMDAYIFDAVNRACGVTEEDLALIARRTRALSPGVARLFVEVAWFNPSLDGNTMVWDQPAYLDLVRQLRLLREMDTRVNLVLFSPLPKLNVPSEPAVRAMLAALDRLIRVEGFDRIRWLTLWNEPDTLVAHDSPLYRRIFGDAALTARPAWSEYVRLNRLAHAELETLGLHPRVRMMVPDTVYGARMRMERMRMTLEAFADLDVAYGYHNYNPENLDFYDGNPDFAYAGMAAEVATIRDLLGPERELILWEFNTAGMAGFGGYFSGVGPGGEDRVSSMAGALDVADKVLTGLLNGLDGCCLWCLHDMIYMGNLRQGVMPFGLWRFKLQKWLPRPLYHYYGALMTALRPAMSIHAVEGVPPGIRALAARSAGGGQTLVLLNPTAQPAALTLASRDPVEQRSVIPADLPADADLPQAAVHSLSPEQDMISFMLVPGELSVLKGIS